MRHGRGSRQCRDDAAGEPTIQMPLLSVERVNCASKERTGRSRQSPGSHVGCSWPPMHLERRAGEVASCPYRRAGYWRQRWNRRAASVPTSGPPSDATSWISPVGPRAQPRGCARIKAMMEPGIERTRRRRAILVALATRRPSKVSQVIGQTTERKAEQPAAALRIGLRRAGAKSRFRLQRERRIGRSTASAICWRTVQYGAAWATGLMRRAWA